MLNRTLQTEYIKEILELRDMAYYSTEALRISTVFWPLNSLKMMNSPFFQEFKAKALDFVKMCYNQDGGFGGSPGYPSTIVTTFTALQILFISDTAFYSSNTVNFIIKHQDKDGGFGNGKFMEKDTRIDCCAVLSLLLLEIMKNSVKEENYGQFVLVSSPFNRNLLSLPISNAFLKETGLERNKAVGYILNCYNADGGFGQIPGAESHAAQVFCCLSSLRALGSLDAVDAMAVGDFLAFRQLANGGLNGRINKKEDVCYSFWVYASAKIIGVPCVNTKALRNFIFDCEGDNGGFSDRPGNECDLYHQMFSLASLSIIGEDDIPSVDPGFAL